MHGKERRKGICISGIRSSWDTINDGRAVLVFARDSKLESKDTDSRSIVVEFFEARTFERVLFVIRRGDEGIRGV